MAGVGPKTAASLLKNYGSVENIYGNLTADPRLEKLARFKEQVELAKVLVTLDRNVPLDGASYVGNLAADYNEARVREYFREFGFETLIKRLETGVKLTRREQGVIL